VIQSKVARFFGMPTEIPLSRQVDRLLHRERALADFGTFAFRELELQAILQEAARVCADCLDVPFSKVFEFRPSQGDLLAVAGVGWNSGVVGFAISVVDESSPQGCAFTTGKPQICPNINETDAYRLSSLYTDHNILSTVDVLVVAKSGVPFGVVEVDSTEPDAFDEHDINFLTSFAKYISRSGGDFRACAELATYPYSHGAAC
jgi:GAF domain-containing protein